MKNYLITTDLSEASFAACAFLREEISSLAEKPNVTLLTVVEDAAPTSIVFEFGLAPFDTKGAVKKAKAKALAQLETVARNQFAHMDVRPEVIETEKSIAEAIFEYSTANQIDRIFIATHGRTGLAHILLGSVAEELVRRAPCPIFIVPTHRTGGRPWRERRNTLAVTDFSSEGEAIVPIVREQAVIWKHQGGNLLLLHVVEDVMAATFDLSFGTDTENVWREREIKAEERVDAYRSRYFNDLLAMTAITRQSKSVAEDIIRFADDRDARLIILSTHGRSGFNHALVGSVAERVTRLSNCPVLVVPVKSRD